MHHLAIYKFLHIIFSPINEGCYFKFYKRLNTDIFFKLWLSRLERTHKMKVLVLCISISADQAPKTNVQVIHYIKIKICKEKRWNNSLGLMAINLSFLEQIFCKIHLSQLRFQTEKEEIQKIIISQKDLKVNTWILQQKARTRS